MCQAQPKPRYPRDWLLASKEQRAGAASGHLQDFLAHVDNSEPVPELGEAIQLGVALLQGHLLFAGQLPAEVLHQLALQRHRRTHSQRHCREQDRQESPTVPSPPEPHPTPFPKGEGALIGATSMGVFGLHACTSPLLVYLDPTSPLPGLTIQTPCPVHPFHLRAHKLVLKFFSTPKMYGMFLSI